MIPPRLCLLGRVAGLPVYLVSGERVRAELDIDFTMGGNGGVYAYCPKGEIWLDDGLNALDLNATALHELVERYLMLQYGWSYDRAHDAASERERVFRRELAKRRPRGFDAARVGEAYRAFLGAQQRGARETREAGRRMDKEIAEAMRAAKRRRAGTR